MADDHDICHAELNDCNEQAADDASERACHNAAGIFDHLDIAVFQAERCREQLDKTCVHTGHDRQFLVRKFAGTVLFITFFFDKLFVVGKNFLDFLHGKCPPLS